MSREDRLSIPPRAARVSRPLVTRDGAEEGARVIPEETAIAFTYGRASYAIMMATPDDLEDFAIGFSLSEGIVATPAEIAELEIVRQPLGIELRMTLAGNRAEALDSRRRSMAGPAGCGLCGIESLSAAVRRPANVSGDVCIAPATIFAAMAALHGAQPRQAEFEADAEHQEHHAEFGDIPGLRRIGNPAHGMRPDQDAHDEVAQHDRQMEQAAQHDDSHGDREQYQGDLQYVSHFSTFA